MRIAALDPAFAGMSGRRVRGFFSVMAGLVPAIHVFAALQARKDVDARHKAGHDEGESLG
jgi:hypothetical protein